MIASSRFLNSGVNIRLISAISSPACAEVVARLQSELFDWALHPRMHITTPNAKIAAYAAQQLQVKNGVLIGIWDEAELGAIRQKIGIKPVG